jgi:hypothetical protein
VGTSTTYNNAATTYVGWQWQAGQGSTSSNTSGTITSTVSVNATAGFSIATFNSGAAGNKTVGHGLGVAPALWIVKQRTGAASSWSVGSKALAVPAARFLALDLTVAVITDTRIWANTAPSSTVLSFESGYTLGANQDCVAYCWAEIAGFSKFGSYTGNVSTNGPFVYTGFRPKFILIKRTDDGTAGWWIWDSARNTYNAANTIIGPNTSSAEFTGAFEIDLLSNGFKLRTANSALNGGTVIYAAFAENPFKNANAR